MNDEQEGGRVWDSPNQQVVRQDESAAWDEGTGGEPGEPQPVEQQEADGERPDLDAMTKAELLEHARELGVSPANNDMSKDELREAIDKKSRKA